MLLASTVTLSEPTLIAVGQGNSETEHEVYIRAKSDATGVVIGGQSDALEFPIDPTDPPLLICLQYEEELWADGTGDIYLLETHLSRTPSL